MNLEQLKSQQLDLLRQWAELRGLTQRCRDRKLVLKLRRLEEQIKTDIRAVEQEIRAELQNDSVRSATA